MRTPVRLTGALVLFVLAASPVRAPAQEAIYVVRHAEQMSGVEDPPLTQVGQQRARALASILADAGITAVYSSHARRTRQTAQPLASSLGLEVRQLPRENTRALIERIRSEAAGGRALVVGHSETLPEILRGLGHEAPITISRSEYHNIFVVVPRDGSAPLVLRQRFQPESGIFAAVLPEVDAETANVSTGELGRVLAQGSAVLLDTRPFMEYALGHIPGALNVAPKPDMPMSEYTSDVAEVGRLLSGDRDRPLLLYCNGPFCGKSRRVAADLVAEGYTDVRRYQLGAPVWRALGGAMAVEAEGVRHVLEHDLTAWLIDARSPESFAGGSLPGALNVWAGQVDRAKDDGRVPMQDHNTRIVVFGDSAAQAHAVAEELTRNAFHNVAYFEGSVDDLGAALGHGGRGAPRRVSAADLPSPAHGELTQATVHESARMVSRIMRLAPGAVIAEHHHPSFEETLVVQSGTVRLSLDDDSSDLRSGDVIYIPAGTVISGRNESADEAVIVVTWARTGRSPALTVPGRPPGHP